MKKSPRFTYNAAAGGNGQSQGSSSPSRHPPLASSTSSASVVQSCSDYSSPRKRKLSPEAEVDEDDASFDDDEFERGMIEAVEEFELSQAEENLDYSSSSLSRADGGRPIPKAQNGASGSVSLQDSVYVLDGENKILRCEKERLMEELRIAKEQMALMKISFDSRQKSLEDQLKKQKQAQNSSTAFLKQEVQELQSKLRTRPTIHTQPAPSSTSKSTLSSAKRKGTSPEIEQGFPSSESFLSSSPVAASQIRTVHVTRKPSLSTPLSQSFKMPPSKKHKTSHSGEASSSEVKPISTNESPSTPDEIDGDFVGLLDVSADLSGAQLLRLLVHKELLKYPPLRSIYRHRAESRADSRNRSPNLLSLLHLPPSRAALAAVSTPSPIFKTPTNRPPQKSRPVVQVKGSLTLNSSMKSSDPVCETKRLTQQDQNPPTSEKSDSANKSIPSSTAHYSLQESMASLLKSTDRLSFNASNPEMPEYNFDSLNMTSANSLDPSSPDGGISLLYIMDSVISTYYTRQMNKYHSSSKNMPIRSLDQLTMDGTYSQSQQTTSLTLSSSSGPSTAESGTCNTQRTAATQKSNRSSNSHTTVADAEKHQVLQALQTVQVLVSYSKPVSKALLTRPPLFCIDSDTPPEATAAAAPESQEEGKEESQEAKGESQEANGESQETSSSDDPNLTAKTANKEAQDQLNTKVFFGENLTPFMLCEEGLSDQVYNLEEETKRKSYQWGSPYTTTPQPKREEVSHIKYTGKLLDTLILLVSAPWINDHRRQKQKDSYEVVLSGVETLTSIAQTGSVGDMERYAPLVANNGLLFLMYRKQAQLTYHVLLLLTLIACSKSIVKQFCNNSNSCLMLYCYSLYYLHLTSSEELFKLHLQLTRFLRQVTKLEEGRVILYQSNDCCSDDLLKSLLTLLVEVLRRLHENEPKDRKMKSRSYLLAKELIRLLHIITLQDRQFAMHRRNCNQVYLYCITAGYRIFKNTELRCILRDLLDSEGLLVEEEREKD